MNFRILVSFSVLCCRISATDPLIPQVIRFWWYPLHSTSIWCIVICTPHQVHNGGELRLSICECVSLVCPILNLVSIRWSAAFDLSEHFLGICLICLRCPWLRNHSVSQVDHISFLIERATSCAGIGISSWVWCLPSLASLSACSLPAIPAWPGTQLKTMFRSRAVCSTVWIHGCLHRPPVKASRQLAESVNTMTFCWSPTSKTAFFRANASAENTLQMFGSRKL